jgi:hypothetical protein
MTTENASVPQQVPQPVQYVPVMNVNPGAVGAPLPPKSVGVAYVLLIFLGLLGIHRFYIGKIGTGVLYLLTGGLFVVGAVVDLFTLANQVRGVNARRQLGYDR